MQVSIDTRLNVALGNASDVYLKGTRTKDANLIVQELCESRGGRPELSVLTSLLVSVEVRNY